MKNSIHRILFATDYSSGCLQAFRNSLEWAQACQAELEIVHVMGVLPGKETNSSVANRYIAEQGKLSQSKIEKMVAQAKERIPSVQSHLLEGMPAEQIIKFAVDSHADLLITGTDGWTGVNRLLKGSVAERVVCQAPCPVLTIRSQEEMNIESAKASEMATPSVPKHILVPVDFSDCSLDAFEYATQIAKWFDASVTLLHALEPLSYSLDFNLTHPIEAKQLRQSIETRFSELADILKKDGLSADYQVGDKPAVDTILRTSTDTQADLLVLGTHGRRGLSRILMGSVTASVLRRSSCPVLTVKSPKFKHQEFKGECTATSESSSQIPRTTPKV